MTFKILSLDGGGMRGVVSATILKQIEEILDKKKGKKLHEYFDLIAGTSTGSILAAGIACQKDAQSLIDLYKKEGKNIFLDSVRSERKWRLLSRLFRSRGLYPNKDKEPGLAEVLQKQLIYPGLGKSPTLEDIQHSYLLILAYDVLSRNTTWFANDGKYDKNGKEKWYYTLPLWKICTASASAPTFFPSVPLWYNERQEYLPHIDGGVAANNPTLAAIAHALSMTMADGTISKLNLPDIAALSIGTGSTTPPYRYPEIRNWGLLDWVKNIPNIFLNPGAENSERIAECILQKADIQNYLRLDFRLNYRFDIEENKLVKLKQPYNGYIFEETKEKKEISEDIDDPNTCDDLILATQCYIKHGEVQWNVNGNNSKITVIKAIERFIELH
jgi:uncharacterized protein